jgi:hypothetical protein
MNKKLLLVCLIITIIVSTNAASIAKEKTNLIKTNVTKYCEEKTCQGYTIFSDIGYKPLLIDRGENHIHEWNLSCDVKVMPGGIALGPAVSREEYIFGREYCYVVQEVWNGAVELNFSSWNNTDSGKMVARQHHDFQREGNPVGYCAPGQEFIENGTTLVLAHQNINVDKISNKELVDDVIYEIDFNGNLTGFE